MRHAYKNQLIELTISSFSKEGHGIGLFPRSDGHILTVEVPFTVPGDVVKVALIKKNRGIYKSGLKEVIYPSPDRVAPRCIHFGSCGGCLWQHLPYEKQLLIKQSQIQKLFETYIEPHVKLHPIVACLPPWQYRNKMEFSFSNDKLSNQYLGLILQGSRGKVFNVQECHLASPWVLDALHAVQQWWQESELNAYHLGKNTGSLRTLIVREGVRTGDRLVMLTVSGNPDFALNKGHLQSFVASIRQAIEPIHSDQRLSIFLRIQQIAKGHPTNFYEMVLYGPDHIKEVLNIQDQENEPPYPLMFQISPSAFFQPNTHQAERLYSRALQMIKIPRNAIVYDLYCGTGTLGICTAKQAKEVLGIELSPESVVDARENIKRNRLSNIDIRQGDVGRVLSQLLAENLPRPDVVMVDPPRVGLDSRAIQHILEIKAPKLLYISCNPVTQSANLEGLIKGGYRLEEIQPVDQFPQTAHVENIIVLHFQDTL